LEEVFRREEEEAAIRIQLQRKAIQEKRDRNEANRIRREEALKRKADLLLQ
jgi:hypothetical protein